MDAGEAFFPPEIEMKKPSVRYYRAAKFFRVKVPAYNFVIIEKQNAFIEANFNTEFH